MKGFGRRERDDEEGLLFPTLPEELRDKVGISTECRIKMDFTLQDNTNVSSVFFDKLSFSSTDVDQKLLKPNSTCPTPDEPSTELSWDLQTFAQRLENLLYWI